MKDGVLVAHRLALLARERRAATDELEVLVERKELLCLERGAHRPVRAQELDHLVVRLDKVAEERLLVLTVGRLLGHRHGLARHEREQLVRHCPLVGGEHRREARTAARWCGHRHQRRRDVREDDGRTARNAGGRLGKLLVGSFGRQEARLRKRDALLLGLLGHVVGRRRGRRDGHDERGRLALPGNDLRPSPSLGFHRVEVGLHGQDRVVRRGSHWEREAIAIGIDQVDVGGEGRGLVGGERDSDEHLLLRDTHELALGELNRQRRALVVERQLVLHL